MTACLKRLVFFVRKKNVLSDLMLMVLVFSSLVFYGCSDNNDIEKTKRAWYSSGAAREYYANDPNHPKFFVSQTVQIRGLNSYEINAINSLLWFDGQFLIRQGILESDIEVIITAGTWACSRLPYPVDRLEKYFGPGKVHPEYFGPLQRIFDGRRYPYMIKFKIDDIDDSEDPNQFIKHPDHYR